MQEANQWTNDLHKAVDFEHIRRAKEFARQTKAANLDIVMVFGDNRRYDVRLSASP
jgi:hypothetical protein